MKLIRFILAAAILGFALAACMTPTQNVALATAATGNAYAIAVLDQNGVASLPALQLLATDLPLIAQGKVSAHDVGVLEGTLQQTKGTLSAKNPKAADQVASLLNLIAQAENTAAGGNLTAQQALVFASCQDVANGINNGIAYWQGKTSVVSPSN